MTVKLKLREDHAQVETKLGVIDIRQIEGGELFTVEFFPNNQSSESFEAGEFTDVWNALEVVTDVDGVHFKHLPNELSEEEKKFIEEETLIAFLELISTIENLGDLKEVTINTLFNGFRTTKTPVYESFRVVKNKYSTSCKNK